MSFFGFDTTLPRDKSDGKRGIFENPDPFAEVAEAKVGGLEDDDDDVLVDVSVLVSCFIFLCICWAAFFFFFFFFWCVCVCVLLLTIGCLLQHRL